MGDILIFVIIGSLIGSCRANDPDEMGLWTYLLENQHSNF